MLVTPPWRPQTQTLKHTVFKVLRPFKLTVFQILKSIRLTKCLCSVGCRNPEPPLYIFNEHRGSCHLSSRLSQRSWQCHSVRNVFSHIKSPRAKAWQVAALRPRLQLQFTTVGLRFDDPHVLIFSAITERIFLPPQLLLCDAFIDIVIFRGAFYGCGCALPGKLMTTRMEARCVDVAFKVSSSCFSVETLGLAQGVCSLRRRATMSSAKRAGLCVSTKHASPLTCMRGSRLDKHLGRLINRRQHTQHELR